jgi:hypothetical protein
MQKFCRGTRKDKNRRRVGGIEGVRGSVEEEEEVGEEEVGEGKGDARAT